MAANARTISIDDHLWSQTKARASALGFTPSDFVRRCIQHGLNETASAEPQMVAYVPLPATAEQSRSASYLNEHAIPLSPCTTYLTIEQAAEQAGLSTKTIRRRVEDGSIPAHRMGPRLVRISQEDLDRFIAGG